MKPVNLFINLKCLFLWQEHLEFTLSNFEIYNT